MTTGATGDCPTSSDARQDIIRIGDLSDGQLRALLRRAETFASGVRPAHQPFSIALVFLQPSLRTRIGFAEAAFRLGGAAHVIAGVRETPDASAPESLCSTLRVTSGMVDGIVVRTHEDLMQSADCCVAPVINAGDSEEHPTQALIDLFAIERFCGDIHRLSIGVAGDMTTRTARSLLNALRCMPPKQVRIIAPPSRMGEVVGLLAPLADRLTIAGGGEWDDLDVLYFAGLPERKGDDVIDQSSRNRYALTRSNVHRLPQHACVLSPMPVIDEVEPHLLADLRIRFYQQSDLGVPVRMAALEWLLHRKNGNIHT